MFNLSIFLAIVVVTPFDGQEVYVAKSAVLKVKDQREIASSATGIVADSSIRVGDFVTVDQLLVLINSSDAELELERLQQEYELAQKDATANEDILYALKSKQVAQADLDRAKIANRRLPGAFPLAELDKLNLLVEKSSAEAKKAEFQQSMKRKLTEVRKVELEIGRAQLAKHKVASPLGGQVTEVSKKVGEWVKEGEVVAKIVSLQELIVEAKVPVELASEKFSNCKVTFIAKNKSVKDMEFTAKLYFIHPEVNPVNSTMKVWFTVSNLDAKLFPGMTGYLEIRSAKQESDASN